MMQIVGSQMEWGFSYRGCFFGSWKQRQCFDTGGSPDKATVWQSWTAARVLYLLGLLCADVC